MNTILRTAAFDLWLARLKDPRGKARIIKRVRAVARGRLGNCRFVGEGVTEMRIHEGPGYRVYFARLDHDTYVLLVGGTKRGQRRDIPRAQQMLRQLKLERE